MPARPCAVSCVPQTLVHQLASPLSEPGDITANQLKSPPHPGDSPGLFLIPEITSKWLGFQHTLQRAPRLPLGLHIPPLLPHVLLWPLHPALLLISLSVSQTCCVRLSLQGVSVLCCPFLLLSSFTLLFPLASGVTIQFGDGSSGKVAWEGVRRASGCWDHPVHGEPLLWNCQRGPWRVPTTSPGHGSVRGAKALVCFTAVEIVPVSARPCICCRPVPYPSGTAGFANALACVCLGWRIAHAELWHLYALF